MKVPNQLKPYFRETMANPNGAVGHYGDCSIYCVPGICDCGLLRTLVPLEDPEKYYSKYYEEEQNHFKKVEG